MRLADRCVSSVISSRRSHRRILDVLQIGSKMRSSTASRSSRRRYASDYGAGRGERTRASGFQPAAGGRSSSASTGVGREFNGAFAAPFGTRASLKLDLSNPAMRLRKSGCRYEKRSSLTMNSRRRELWAASGRRVVEVVGEASNIDEACDGIEKLFPDVVS